MVSLGVVAIIDASLPDMSEMPMYAAWSHPRLSVVVSLDGITALARLLHYILQLRHPGIGQFAQARIVADVSLEVRETSAAPRSSPNIAVGSGARWPTPWSV